MFQAPAVTLTGRTAPLRGGLAGVGQTLKTMRAYVNEARKNLNIRQAAVNAVFMTPSKDDLHEVEAIFSFVQGHIRYVMDVLDVETLCDPVTTLKTRVGDCDDQTMLLCALFESVGYPTRFVVAAYDGGDVSHVYCQVWADGHWMDCDPTESGPVGWAPPDPSDLFVEEIYQ